MDNQVWHHQEKIVCPSCGSIESAIVERTSPWWSYIHNCKNCGYTIMESEWEKAAEPSLKSGQKVWVKSEKAWGEVRRFVGCQVNVYFGEGIGDALFDWDDLRWKGLEHV